MSILAKIKRKSREGKNTWVSCEDRLPTESGFYWVYDRYYYGVTVGFFDASYGNRGQWEVWREKRLSVYRQTDIFVTHWRDFDNPGEPEQIPLN